MNKYYINPIFPFALPMKSYHICYVKAICSSIYIPVSYYIPIFLIFIHLIMTLFVYFILRKVYMYAFHLKQGGVM